jgi:Mg2+-importing ATPase
MSDPGDGLSSAEAAKRLVQFGENRLAAEQRGSLLRRLLARFGNPLVLVLLAAAGVAGLTGDVASFAIVTLIVSASIAIDVTQEHQAQTAVARLQARVETRSRVRRDGREVEVRAREIVPGDVVLLAAGDLIPADCRLIEGHDLFVNEAALTGESFPVEKRPASGSEDGEAREPDLFLGSSILSGSGLALVERTGARTRLGEIGHAIERPAPPSAFALHLREFGLLIVRLTVLLVLLVLLVNLLAGRPVLETFLFAVALAVGLTPELLPMIVSVTLARGAVRMARSEVIVKRLSAIHDLGGMTVLCSDKTGTLTEARIKLVREVDAGGNPSRHVLELAYLNSAFETGLRSPLDEAILAAERMPLEGWRKLDEVPFDFERRRVSVLCEQAGRRLLIVKGAPEDVLGLCASVELSGSATPVPLGEERRAAALEVFAGLGREGFRCLGVAWREIGPGQDHARMDDEAGLIFAGFAAFLDPPKADAAAALEALSALGVSVKVVTGDNENVTRHVCRELGLADGPVLLGPEISRLSDEALQSRVGEVALFCRVTPPQKARIIRALRQRGYTVGYLGDGINDAPSLHAADVGLSVDDAVDVAKAGASIVLLRKDLGVLVEGVREGRRTSVNIMKYIMMGTSSNFGNMLSMAGATLVLPFLPMLPIQILLNNLIYDTSELAIPFDRVDPQEIARPPAWDPSFIRRFMLTFGPISSVFDFLTFAALLLLFGPAQSLFQTGWFIESMATQILVIFIIRSRLGPLRSRPHPYLLAAALTAVLVAVALPFTPLGVWFHFATPPPTMLLLIALLTAGYLVTVMLAKRIFDRRGENRPRPRTPPSGTT